MTNQEDLKRKRRVPINIEFMEMLFDHPDNYYVEGGIPDGSNFVEIYTDPARDCAYAVFQNDDWPTLQEAEKIPEMNVEFRERFCQKCESEMMYDEENNEQYCPRCERRFYCGG